VDRVQVVVIKLGQQSFAMLLSQVENVIAASDERLERQSPHGTMPLWLSPPRLRYLSDRLPIVELSRKLGMKVAQSVDNCEMVIARVGGGVRCALAVDRAQGITQTELDCITPLPRWLNREASTVWGSYINGTGEIVLLLDCEALFTSAERSWLTTS
jgi:chemotaxis signal transduction protein